MISLGDTHTTQEIGVTPTVTSSLFSPTSLCKTYIPDTSLEVILTAEPTCSLLSTISNRTPYILSPYTPSEVRIGVEITRSLLYTVSV